jgi:predicted RecB family nuclease
VNDDVFAAFLKCPYKAYLKLHAVSGEESAYAAVQARLAGEYRAAATQAWLGCHGDATVLTNPPSLLDALREGASLITDVTASEGGNSCHLDAVEWGNGHYRPVLFVRRGKVTADDRLVLAFGASILGRVQGTPPDVGKVVHGPGFKQSRVALPTLSEAVHDRVAAVEALAAAPVPPPLVLNRHCPECEFRYQCRAAAVEKDDLSLLRGLSAKEIAGLHARGLFTVTQYSYTFRPGRMKRAGKKHDHSLQALALREKTVYVAQRPQLPEAKAQLYLDVEGLPDEEFYYLIGLTITEGDTHRRLSFWADTQAEEGSMWATFLAAVGAVGDFAFFHYGSYEAHFLKRMRARYGGDAALLARIEAASVNVLSLIYSRVYFPAHANDLKSVAGCLGFRWSVPEASGLQAIAWRYAWQETKDEPLKQQLLAYNQEDCSALEVVVDRLRFLGSEHPPRAEGPGPRVADVADAPGPYRHRMGSPQFALPEMARITRCAYFDYQRDKVLCRTNPRVKKVARRKRKPRREEWKTNREVVWDRPTACPYCGSGSFDTQSNRYKFVIDLKPFRSGIKRQVTRHRARRYRCCRCRGTFLPADYLAQSPGYGWGVYSWVVYSTISLRQSNEAIAEALEELFGIRFGRGYASKIRQWAAERYGPTYDALVTALRNSPVAHADETKVPIKGVAGDGYVWVFATPDTAVYVYAPTREGDTARAMLAGFKGVLVSDFYAAYDSLDCPQQKCLIHLIRDFNDDLLKNPFDEELKQQAARFTALLQAAVETVDRYGLKSHHLHKHKKDVGRYYAAESSAEYRSERARHYQQRVLKYRDKLFTFLDYDGVPWNNNNAENAVKRFVSRRKTLVTPFTEGGIRDYLVLLSIYQTLRYRNASFWQFLLSGETDIEA